MYGIFSGQNARRTEAGFGIENRGKDVGDYPVFSPKILVVGDLQTWQVDAYGMCAGTYWVTSENYFKRLGLYPPILPF